MSDVIKDFFRRHGAIAMNPDREKYMRMPLESLITARNKTLAALEIGLNGSAYSDAIVRLQDLDAVIALRTPPQPAPKPELPSIEDAAAACAADIKAIGPDALPAAKAMLVRVAADPRCTARDQEVARKTLELLGR